MAQPTARRASSLPATTRSGSRCSTGMIASAFAICCNVACEQLPARQAAGPPTGAFAPASVIPDLTCPVATSARARPSPMPEAPTESRCASATVPMISRSVSNTASTMAAATPCPASSARRARRDRRPLRDGGKVGKADLLAALARQHPHQIGIMHRVERVILQRAFIQRHRADEQVALIHGAAGPRERRRDQHDGLAAIGAQRIHHRADIAGIGGIEGRADLEQHVRGAAPAQPFFGGARLRHRLRRLDRAALQGDHHRIDLGHGEIVRRHTDGLHRAQARTRQRVGEVGGAGIIVGNAAQLQGHDVAPAGLTPA